MDHCKTEWKAKESEHWLARERDWRTVPTINWRSFSVAARHRLGGIVSRTSLRYDWVPGEKNKILAIHVCVERNVVFQVPAISIWQRQSIMH